MMCDGIRQVKIDDSMSVEDVFGFWMNDFKLKFFVLLLI